MSHTKIVTQFMANGLKLLQNDLWWYIDKFEKQCKLELKIGIKPKKKFHKLSWKSSMSEYNDAKSPMNQYIKYNVQTWYPLKQMCSVNKEMNILFNTFNWIE